MNKIYIYSTFKKILFACLVWSISNSSALAQCGCTNCPLNLPDILTEQFIADIVVDNTANNTLGVGGQCLQSVCVDITHDYIGDLDITLIAPDGTSVILFADGNSDSSLGGSETSPFGITWDNMNVCFVLPGNADTDASGDPLIFGTLGTGNCSNTASYTDPCNGPDILNGDCYVDNWEPWDAGCNGTNGVDEFNNGAGTVSGTWQIVINDNANENEGQINDVTLNFCIPPDGDCTTTVNCGANAGTITNSAGTNEVFLCDNETITLTSNDDFTLSDPAGTDPIGLGYAVYDCAPDTNLSPADDPCFTGYYFTGEDLSETNATGNAYEFISTNPIPGFAALGGGDLYFVPSTMDDICSDTTIGCDDSLGTDVDGDGCYGLGTPVHVTYVPQVTVTSVNDCAAGTVTYTFSGGTPMMDGSNFAINSTGAGTPSATTAADGASITFSGLADGDIIVFSYSDDNCNYGTESFTFNCSDVCLVNYTLTPNPLPSDFPNNQYPANTTVEFCFDINQYLQSNINFLHGIVPSVSGAWDATSIAPVAGSEPQVAANNENGSYWDWLPGNSVTYNSTGVPIADAGWWFFSVNSPGGVTPTDTNDSWGDGCTATCYTGTDQVTCEGSPFGVWIPGCGCSAQTDDPSFGFWVGVGADSPEADVIDPAMTEVICLSEGGLWYDPSGGPPSSVDQVCIYYGTCYGNTVDGFDLQWNACFEVTTIDCVSPYTGPYDLGISVETYADGETGIWTDLGCLADLPATYDTEMCCIEPPATLADTFCEGDDMTVTGATTDAAYTLNWYSVATGGLPIGTGTTYDPGALTEGTYTYYIEQDLSGCRSERTPITITVNPAPEITIEDVSAIEICVGQSVDIDVTITDFDSFTWDSGQTTQDITVTPTTNTTYTLDATNASCGTKSEVIDIFVFDVPDITVTNPAPVACGADFDLSTVVVTDATTTYANSITPTITYHSASPPDATNQINSLLTSASDIPTAGTYTYYIQSEAYICTDFAPVTITVEDCCSGTVQFIKN